MNADSAATLIYTSGTTGRPKGVQLKHRNLYAESAAAAIQLPDSMVPGKRTLLFLPLAHVFARLISFAAFDNKVTVAHTSDLTTLLDQFAEFKPNFILSVPRVFEKVYNSAKQKAYDGGKGKIFEKASDTAIEYSQALEAGGPGLGLKLKHALFDKLVYGKLRAALGGNATQAVSGGAALGARLGHFFRGVGVNVLEGYGLTETTGGVVMNTPPGNQKVGTVGRPFNGHSAKIAEDGELLLKGPVVFEGYWKNEQATKDALVDGWFHTGDIATVDADGFISITGRKKELIVTAGGKNVAPGRPRGLAARAPADQPGDRRRRLQAVHRRDHHPRPPRGPARLEGTQRCSGRHDGRGTDQERGPDRRDRRRGRRHQQEGVEGRSHQEVPDPGRRLHSRVR